MFTIRVSAAGIAGDPMKLLVAECPEKDMRLTETFMDGPLLGRFNMCRAKRRLETKFVECLCSACGNTHCEAKGMVRG